MIIHLPKKRKRKAADLYCGGGGTTTGAWYAAQAQGVDLEMLAVNHWDVAVDTHATNHPWAQHLCESVDDVRPERYFKMGELDDLFASPECTHFSRARTGLPVDDQRRCGARRVVDWAERVKPKQIYVENVMEFLSWGPLKRNRAGEWVPDEKFKGALFRNWVHDLETLGYRVEWRLQCCANFGAPTTRTRLIIRAARKPLKIVWPEASHRDPQKAGNLFGELPAWIPAREIIDWSIPCPSIFTRLKALSDNTLYRIEAGLRAQGIEAFLVQVAHGESGGRRWRALSETMKTITCVNGHALVVPFLCELRGTAPEQLQNSHRGLDEALSTITAGGTHHALVMPSLLPQQSAGRLRPVSEPCPTVATAGAIGLLRPQVIEYYGTATHREVTVPLGTVTCRDRFGLSLPKLTTTDGRVLTLDIGYRMLQAHELAAAMSFPTWYQFKGTKKDVTRQIGNAVPPKLAEAHYAAVLMERRAA